MSLLRVPQIGEVYLVDRGSRVIGDSVAADMRYWYYINDYRNAFNIHCQVWRSDGTTYRSVVTEDYILRGIKVFNAVRFKGAMGLPLVWA